MKILHVCLANFYIDNYSYQENVLPKMHKKIGHQVKIIASTETFINGKHLGYVEPSIYMNEDGIEVRRIPYVKWLPSKVVHKLRIYPNFYSIIEEYNPNIIFLHDVQFLSLRQIIRYAKKHPTVRIIADGHADFSNSANTFLSRWVLHELVYKPIIRLAEPYIEKFYGVLPARVDFFKAVYGIPPEKVSFLPMGVDDDLAELHGNNEMAMQIRKECGIANDDFVIVSGGKIDLAKTQTLLLMQAINNIANPKIKLLIFGSVVDSLKDKFDSLCSDRIKYLGWATVQQSYEYFAVADLVMFPGRHSVYWEQSAGMGKPLIVKYWAGTTHVDLGGNVEFLYEDSVEEMQTKIEGLVSDTNKYSMMKKNAEEKGKKYFSYYDIAKRCIES